jgi:Uma2 family endonuclease
VIVDGHPFLRIGNRNQTLKNSAYLVIEPGKFSESVVFIKQNVKTYMERFELHFPETLQFDDEEFFAFCQANPELKLERTKDGEIIVMALTGGKTGIKNSEIIAELTIWNRQAKTGYIFDSSTGFRLPNGATRSPDAAWIAGERWEALPEVKKEKFPPLCPDFVIELKSDSDGLKSAQAKMLEWLENGCRLAWLLDPQEGKLYIYQPGKEVEVQEGFTGRLSGAEILPGFELDLKLLR